MVNSLSRRIFRARQARRQRGEGLMSFYLALGLFAALLPLAMNYLERSEDLDIAHQAANHQNQMMQAATKYINNNYQTILDNAAAGTVVITPAMLRAAGYLSASVPDTNVNQQTYEVLADQTASAAGPILQVIMPTFGGNPFTESQIRDIARVNVLAGGGFISKLNPGVAQGYGGTYSIPLASYGVSPGAGHVVMGLFFNNQGLVSDWLARNAVPGHPELNTMNTAINMNGNNINNANEVNAASLTTTATAQVGTDLSVTGNATIGGNSTVTGAVTAGGLLTAQGQLQLDGTAVQGAFCPQAGRLAQDGTGLPLACKGGIWTAMGKGGGEFSLTRWISNGSLYTYTGNPMDGGALACPPGFTQTGGMETGQESYYGASFDLYTVMYFCN